jgi:capsid portal protein
MVNQKLTFAELAYDRELHLSTEMEQNIKSKVGSGFYGNINEL